MAARLSSPSSSRSAQSAAAILMAAALFIMAAPAWAQNPIVTENALAGNPASEWDIAGAGDPSIQGFATDISVDRGETVRFKIGTDAAAYQVQIYRLGYYQGDGARLVGTGVITATLPQSQPAPLYDPATGLTDCGNWSESAHWDVPANAVSGIYIARLTRTDTNGASHIVFIVRDDASTSALYFKTSDATWQAYNVYGGNSLYIGSVSGYPGGHATKVSYNRPFLTRAGGGGGGAEEDWLFNAEYPMVRWLEANGYDVTYTTDVDADRRGNLIAQHDVLLSVGHDEYWSAAQRANITAARDAGTHLAFFSGNEVYWKTRWEPSSDGSATAYRTLVCYKEGTLGENACGGKCDPLADTWTGLWRDGCAFPAADGCDPENALSGQISWGLGEAGLQVPDTFSGHRFWRNTSVAALGAGQTATLGARILGYEYDYEQYPASYPAGRVTLSGTTVGGHLHRLSLYRAPSGALVFGAGTVQWSWGLDGTHDRGNDAPVQAIRQATVNLLADMGVQPGSLQPGLNAAVPSGDALAPTSTITAPLDGASLPGGVPVAITGTSTEAGGGLVAAVDVSTDGGATWVRATGGAGWSYTWTPEAAGGANLRVRAVDDLGNLEAPGAGINVTVTEPPPPDCPCNVFLAGETPANPDNNDGQPIEPGMKFRASVDGFVTGVRYHKGAAWTTGTRLGHLWSAAGAQLAEVTFTGETASGWQEALFTTPVAVTAGTTYVVSIYSPSGHYAFTSAYFGSALVRPPLRALANGEDGPNGVYFYGGTGFPTSTFNASNYWVDVVFDTGPDETPPTVSATSPAAGASGVSPFAAVSATFSEPLDAATVTGATFELRDAGSALVPATVAWDAGTRTATLTPGVQLTTLATYTATLRGGPADPRIKDVAGNALAADVTWSFTIAAPDLTPPTVASTVPAQGATGVATAIAVEVVFDEPMSPATIGTTTLELRDALNALVPATVAYNVYLNTATLTPAAPLAANTLHTLTVKGGGADPRVKDLSGNPLAADYTTSFTTGSGFGCPCTVFLPSDTPAQTDVTDGQPLELGMKFRTTVNGYVTGVRFWKGVQNTGTHVGSLWSSGGVQLASITFTGESASGWQQASFGSPVAITANTTYVISYHSPSYFSTNTQYFNGPVGSGPVVALADGTDGANGVYAYSATPAFPNLAPGVPYDRSNYWVDVVFETEVGPDVTPPTVTATVPTSGASGVAVGANVTATFSEALDGLTVDGTTFELREGANPPLAATVSWSAATLSAILDPAAPLAYSTVYTATLKGGGTDPRLKDLSGNALAADVTWSFTTSAAPPPPPDEGPGGPVLVISRAADPFGRYYAEILRCEGLNAFRARDLSLVTAATLDSHEVAILAPAVLSAAEVAMFETWVNAGGSLIAVRPDAQLATLLGLTVAGGTLSNAYLAVDTAAPPGQGIVGETIQFHDTADLWTLSGATAVATLYSDATTATANPAVTLRSVGGNGGWAAAFTYDLARSIVYTRQGNPAWAGDERDGTAPIRSNDLFYGNKAGDPQPDWVDLDKVAIPQADEQQRLLANLMLHISPDGMPLPRFWYFPKGKKAVVIHTGDNHGTSGTPVRFDANLAQSPGGCSLPDWECVRSTSYLYAGGPLTDAQVASYQSQGFEIGIHLNTGCANWTPATLDQFWTDQLAGAQSLYPSLLPQTTHRTHCIAWSDWASQAEIQAARGVRLDVNYYYWPPGWVQNRPGMFTGSAMPMRYARLDGTMVDCFQAATQMTDESGQSYPMTPDSLLTRALDVRGYYGAFCTNIHLDGSSETINAQVVSSALSRGVPVVSAAQMLEWIDGRNGSSFQDLSWNGSDLTFAIAVGAGALNLRAMLPAQRGNATLQTLTRNAVPVAFTTETIKGVAYAFFPAEAGSYAATYAVDATPPAISAVTATPAGDGTALVTWTTDEPSDSRVDYGTDAGTLGTQVADAALVTSHAVTLTGLAANTTYHFRVTSEDAVGNAATSPDPPAAPATFTTPAGPCAADRTAADFALGTATTTTLTTFGDGEVSLVPAYATDFPGAALPAGWSTANGAPWTGGTPAVSGGLLSVNGCIAGTQATFGDGVSVEFVATFQAEAFQHVGFVGDLAFNNPWIIVSTGSSGGGIYARSNDNAAGVLLAGTSFAVPHRYRIDRMGTKFRFWVDGVLRDSLTQTGAASVIVAASDLNSNATAVTVDWVRVSPYGSPGEYVSRVHDAGQSVNWGAATWAATVPDHTGLAVSVRTGDTPAPDGTWTSYLPLAGPGASVSMYARYLQYRADLTSADGRVSPALEEIEFACTPGADESPPVLTALAALPGAGGTSATVTWNTNEPATSVVDYGTSPGALTLQESNPALVTSHVVTLTGLTPATLYHFRASSADAATNSATSPALPADPATFTTPAPPIVPCLADSLVADFAAGSHAGTHVAATGNGEVILAPAEGSEFTGATLPAGWASQSYGGGGASATLTGSAIQLDGSFVRTDALSYFPDRSVEFVATFDAVANGQHAGFGNTLNETQWAIFSTGPAGGTLLARTNQGGSALEQNLGASYLGAPHRFRVDWGVSSVGFWIDGVQVATIGNAVSGPLRPIASDGPVGGNPLVVDWMRMTPYAANGTFLSRVLDAGGSADWGAATWDASAPAGTALVMSVRTGDTAVPDGSWTSFATLAAPGADAGGTSRYLQYRAELSTGDPLATPELRGFGVACEVAPDQTPPVISAVAAAPSLTTAIITWTTDEPATSVVDYGTSAGSLGTQVASGTLVTSHSVELTGLTAGTLYHYRVTSLDGSNNPASDPVPPGTRTFTTAAPACLTDATSSDFALGSLADTYLSETTDGEVILAPTLANEFSGAVLPADWTSVPWSGGTSTVSGGVVTVDGARLTPLSTAGHGIGRALEFVATFGAAHFQNAGLGAGDNSLGATGMFATGAEPWAMFGTAGTTTTLFARLNPDGDVSLGTGYLGAPHRYRIEWWTGGGGDSVAFFIDGASVDRRATTIPTATLMRPGISDFDLGGPALAVSWVRLSPHATPGSFLSRVYDSGGIATWERLTWNADLPAGTALAMSVRQGNTPAPDGSWSAFQAVAASGDVVGGSSRYVQYRAELSTVDPGVTPALRDVSLACTVCAEATPPPAIADLSATGTGNAGGGRAHVRLEWSGVTEGHLVKVYRKAYGDYPLYRATHGGVPAVPATPAAAEAAGWDSTTVHATSALDAPPTRGFWYYVGFVTNGCGLVSAPSNLTGGTLDYILGDVSDGNSVCAAGGEAGNTVVNTADISALGDEYGQTFGTTDDRVCLDVGPTVDYGIRSRPTPDGYLNFEDLVVYALNYEIPLPAVTATRPARSQGAADRDELVVRAPAAVQAGETFDVVLHFRGTGAVRALSAQLAWDAAVAEIGAPAPAGLLTAHGGVALSPAPGTVDAAVLGASSPGIAGEGELVVVSFRALRDGDPAIRLDRALARDSGNRPVAMGAAATPAPPIRYATALGRVFPSPFQGTLSVSFSLAAETPVKLVVYDLAGRAVRRLEEGARPAGVHLVTWDGRNDAGRAVSAGLYLIRFEAGGVRETRRVQLIR